MLPVMTVTSKGVYSPIAFIALLLAAVPLGAQRNDGEVIERAVVQQMLAYCSTAHFCHDAVQVEHIGMGSVSFSPLVRPSLLRSGLRVYRAKFASIDHVPEYIVAVNEDGVWKLGGFPSPEVRDFVRMLDLNGDPEELASVAQMLAVMLDAHGAVGIVGADSSRLSGAIENATFREGIALWQRGGMGQSVRDTLFVRSDSLTVAVVNVISASHQIGDIVWRPIRYAFIFDQRGQLVSWDRRFGDPMTR